METQTRKMSMLTANREETMRVTRSIVPWKMKANREEPITETKYRKTSTLTTNQETMRVTRRHIIQDDDDGVDVDDDDAGAGFGFDDSDDDVDVDGDGGIWTDLFQSLFDPD